jgi:ArsR family transcriptional regulator
VGQQAAVEMFRSCIPLFHALSDPARQDIILLLAEKERLTVNEIAEAATLSRPAISHHLKVLRDTGLVGIEQKGTQRIYSLTLDGAVEMLKKLVETVEENCILEQGDTE